MIFTPLFTTKPKAQGFGLAVLPDSGTNCLDLNGNQPGSISVTFNTTPGTNYVIRFAYTKNPDSSLTNYPDYVALATQIATKNSPVRELGLCPGCPHRASFFSLNKVLKQDNRVGFVCGDIGCYTLGALPAGLGDLLDAASQGNIG